MNSHFGDEVEIEESKSIAKQGELIGVGSISHIPNLEDFFQVEKLP